MEEGATGSKVYAYYEIHWSNLSKMSEEVEVKFISTHFMDSILLFLFGMYFWIEYYKESHIILAKPILFQKSIAVYIHALYRFTIWISENIQIVFSTYNLLQSISMLSIDLLF